MAGLKEYGYDLFPTTDLQGFNKRSLRTLGFETPIVEGTGKVWDYRASFGLMFQELLKDYDFWGTTDLDVVYGNIEHFYPDDLIKDYDIITDEDNYIGGHFTLYRNNPEVNNLFSEHEGWLKILLDPFASGWVEKEYSELALRRVRVLCKRIQASRDNTGLEFKNGCLFQHGVEVGLAHFRDQKRWVL